MKLADHQSAVVAEVGRPPLLRLCHQGMEVLDHGLQVEALELLGVVERLAHWIGQSGVPMETLEVQLVRPPVTVRLVHDRAFARAFVGLCVHVSLQLCSRFFPVPYTRIVGSWKVIQLHGPPNKASWHAQQKSGSRAISESRRCIAQSDVGTDNEGNQVTFWPFFSWPFSWPFASIDRLRHKSAGVRGVPCDNCLPAEQGRRSLGGLDPERLRDRGKLLADLLNAGGELVRAAQIDDLAGHS